ncbi:MAG: maltose alpha-D-glucosyltransferase [Elusimicrobia bacterium]|jgi:maltose alpha-D-glucosyltransferase/alpha-amylase|nr:maltose alpha-D-glucosyltransferase [Elusimicrobiota bacterium]
MSPKKPGKEKVKKVPLTSEPMWYKDAIIYEIHVKSFFDSNDDGVGDFPGLIQKLDYFQSLGVNCLWLLPFYPSPLKDDGYDISDYENIHPTYGTMKDFRNFIKETHKRGIRVITELVVNHTSDQHPWFQAARKAAPGSAARNFYVWSDTDQLYKEARIIFTDSEKSNWTWDPVAKAYYWHRFFHHQPDLNFDNPQVVRAVMKTMRFWLDAGVDGVRLDAVPYLIERDGTSCENLPETHKILKRLRKEMDRRYKDRMFLAEANQWPADVRAYYGDGDECHMAFHFPLMPRLFMALRQEDRHPITEIIRQTPEIPPNCQWAIFLRNHDELTLEMVTDEERDYMYDEYANDPQMRLNIGIRRRLAPLMDHSRRQLELLTSILLSFPGTPLIYYGDELGMGDNVFLGDRNGVRTPMQWTGDRNAGFSRADPARLFCPPIMDPVYGYQSISVEAQERDPSSLLNWMRRMIALRKHYKVFGRGTMEFIYPQNRNILAYVRRYENDTILAVVNLSRNVQPVELDLSQFKGLTPVELMGRVEFPSIGDLPYFLTLSPHSFYWFQIQRPTASATTRAVEVTDFPALPVTTGKESGQDLFVGRSKKLLETNLLPAFIFRQRWFAGKGRRQMTCRITDWGELVGGESPTFFLMVTVDGMSGAPDRYAIPLAIARGEAATALVQSAPGSIVARLGSGESPALLYDAARDDAAGRAWIETIESSHKIETQKGSLRGEVTPAFAQVLRDTDKPFKIAPLSAEQSNTSILYGERFILKIFRRLSPGINPDWEIGRHLTQNTEFKNAPRTCGMLEYVAKGEEPSTFGILHQQRENQGSGWTHALNELKRYFERVLTRSDNEIPPEIPKAVIQAKEDLPPIVTETIGVYMNAASTLGRRTAELHQALATAPEGETAFTPEPLTVQDMTSAVTEMKVMAQKSLRALEYALGRLSGDARDKAHRVLSERTRLLDRLKSPKSVNLPGGRIRCHGDYHLGQVLWVENDFVILDFEGEPSRTLEDRRAKQSPLKDVAGMLGSIDYAVHTALAQLALDRPEIAGRMVPWAMLWRNAVSLAFLKTYRQTAEGKGFSPEEDELFDSILNLYLLDKSFYELHYEINNRPNWAYIPMEKLLAFLDKK